MYERESHNNYLCIFLAVLCSGFGGYINHRDSLKKEAFEGLVMPQDIHYDVSMFRGDIWPDSTMPKGHARRFEEDFDKALRWRGDPVMYFDGNMVVIWKVDPRRQGYALYWSGKEFNFDNHISVREIKYDPEAREIVVSALRPTYKSNGPYFFPFLFSGIFAAFAVVGIFLPEECF